MRTTSGDERTSRRTAEMSVREGARGPHSVKPEAREQHRMARHAQWRQRIAIEIVRARRKRRKEALVRATVAVERRARLCKGLIEDRRTPVVERMGQRDRWMRPAET